MSPDNKRHKADPAAGTTLHIKNMVCDRCIAAVRELLTTLGLRVRSVELGRARVIQPKAKIGTTQVRDALRAAGFDLVEDRELQIVEKIKTAVIDLVHHSNDGTTAVRNSEYLAARLGHSYEYLARLFSRHENLTLEKYIILQKIEKVKELLDYGELTVSEIAYRLGYSSVQHLSKQFKQNTGITISRYRSGGAHERKTLDTVNTIKIV